MRKYFLFAIIFPASCLFSCNADNEETENSDTTTELPSKDTKRSCYLYSFNQDTIRLSIEDADPSHIIGNLEYIPFEKDARIGMITKGKMCGDTLFASYQSEQEGQQSDCEIALLKTPDAYIITREIWGTENYQYDTSFTHGSFKNKSHIRFDGGDTLKKSNCW